MRCYLVTVANAYLVMLDIGYTLVEVGTSNEVVVLQALLSVIMLSFVGLFVGFQS